MNELKTTPGPWLRNGDFVFALDETQTVNRMSLLVSAEYVNWDTKRPALESESVANAALIAAAPELYAALEALFACDMEHVLMFDGKEDQVAAIQLARAALKKARGEA